MRKFELNKTQINESFHLTDEQKQTVIKDALLEITHVAKSHLKNNPRESLKAISQIVFKVNRKIN